jgi:hypothetical protein
VLFRQMVVLPKSGRDSASGAPTLYFPFSQAKELRLEPLPLRRDTLVWRE